jgi:hypothetical protein
VVMGCVLSVAAPEGRGRPEEAATTSDAHEAGSYGRGSRKVGMGLRAVLRRSNQAMNTWGGMQPCLTAARPSLPVLASSTPAVSAGLCPGEAKELSRSLMDRLRAGHGACGSRRLRQRRVVELWSC